MRKIFIVIGALAASTVVANAVINPKLSCSNIVGDGWNHMPDVADYVTKQPHADKLGYGSECAIGGLVFAQCWLTPRLSVSDAITLLIRKAVSGEKLPDTPACGA